MKSIFQVVGLLLVAWTGTARGETVWWEAEAAKETNMPVASDDPQAISGGQWLTGPMGEGLYATYPVTVADGGRYTFLTRRFWLHGAFRWRFDEGEWVEVQGLNQSIVDQVAGKPGPMAWTDLGYVTLSPGAHTLRIEGLPQSAFQFNKTYGFDCFALSNDCFAPKGIDRQGGPRLPDPKPDEALYGKFLPRTMALLESATPEHRTPVDILFYGQSIVGNSHIEVPLGKWLREKYPNAVIHVENIAIGGYEAPMLRRTSWQDLYPKSPDLVVFQDYGGENGELEEMFQGMRKNLTAEVLTWTPHVDNFGAGIDRQRDASAKLLQDLGAKCGLEVVDLRTLWKENLKETHLERGLFLVDQIHLNPKGIDFLFRSLIPHFRDNPAAPDDWKKKARALALASPDAPGVSFDAGTWTRGAEGLVSAGTAPLRIAFSGNRLDLVGLSQRGAGTATLRLDGKVPSSLRETLAANRSTLAPGAWWPVLTRVTVADNAVADEYTLHFHDISPDGTAYAFDAVGAASGADGSGKAGADFVSASGRIAIAADDIALSRVMKTLKKPLPAQLDVVFRVYPMGKDAWAPPKQLSPGRVPQETVVRSWRDGPHVLEIVPNGDGPVGIREALVFSPSGLD